MLLRQTGWTLRISGGGFKPSEPWFTATRQRTDRLDELAARDWENTPKGVNANEIIEYAT